ncbi:(Fe-S)-binding protein [Isoptericola sp. b441]|uniref:(Fe-S)-binding protein n=1 Tax=Actinotalea lenta TaxID=3064654 RepID=A0ABT9D6W6_9CELL|nr:(Fe-S)-binding protein [Isoptericola sp. b441]MDO8106270.1 (Fe-S)-binding protein [Isoptericola sp. b441]
MSGLQVIALVLVVLATVLGVVTFARGVAAIVATVRRGGPAPDRTTSGWLRTRRTLAEILGHDRFRHRPAIRLAHWAVMISFPVLFLTLVAGYGEVVNPVYVLPGIGTWIPYEWAVELFAWGGLVGIVTLIVQRQLHHPRRGSAAVAEQSAARRGADGELVGPDGPRASRFFGSNAGQAYLVEGVILAVVLAVIGLRALEYALGGGRGIWWATFQSTSELTLGRPSFLGAPWWQAYPTLPQGFDVHYPLTAWLGSLLARLPIGALATAVVVLATVKILVSMAWLVVVGRRPAMGVAWHRFLAVVNVWARRRTDGRPALGAAEPLRAADGTALDLTTLEDLPEDLMLGVGRVEDFTWKGLLDLSSCTECGRCTEQCPAWNTGKPLSPKLVITALRDHTYATTPGLWAGPNRSTAPAGATSATGVLPLVPGSRGSASGGSHAEVDVLTLVGDVVTPEALWDCTMCGACVQQCPVDIEHVDHLLDLRRNQVLLAGAFPGELGQMFSKLERRGNPWGMPGRKRMAWAEPLAFPVPVVGEDVEDASGLDCLFWVGCAGAYDDRGQQVARAVAELLHTAGVSFAVLGNGETCTGDPARRAGNEALFQQLAHTSIESLEAAKPTRIVTTCAHCFNTIANEYPQLGGHFTVLHHTELLETLVAEGRLTPVQQTGADVTYHDPCYLGRHNQVYYPPRALLGAAGATVTEMPRSGERSFCCGGGGARVWMEETTGRRIAGDRVDEAAGTGAEVLATACPFCTVMLTDASRSAGGRAPVVRDVAEVLLDAVRGGEGGPAGQ